MARQSVFDMKLSRVYPLLLAKVERKGRTKKELDKVIAWLTGYDMSVADMEMTYREFFDGAPDYNSNAELIKGKICGVEVSEIEDPLMKKIRQMEKLVDELAKGKTMEKILRS